MTNYKPMLMLLFSILLLNLAFAEPANINDTFTIWATVDNQTSFVDATDAEITLYSPSGVVYVTDDAMVSLGSGLFSYDYAFNETGNWIAETTFYTSGDQIAVGRESITVSSANSSTSGGGLSVSAAAFSGEAMSIVIALAVVVILLLWFAFQLEDKHMIFKLVCIFFAMGLVLLIPKAMLDYNDHCSLVPVNSSTVGGATTIGYDYVCAENTSATAFSFYKGVAWFVRVFWFYVAGYFIYEIILFFGGMFFKGGKK